jgi:hypothetical protein
MTGLSQESKSTNETGCSCVSKYVHSNYSDLTIIVEINQRCEKLAPELRIEVYRQYFNTFQGDDLEAVINIRRPTSLSIFTHQACPIGSDILEWINS